MNVKEKGAALVEFALAAMLFLTVLFSIIEFSYLWWVNLTMQHAMREGARYAAVTGPSNFPTPTPQNPATQAEQRCNAVGDAIRANSMGLYDRVSPTLTYSTVNRSTGNIVAIGSGCGGANDIIMIKLVATLPLITPILKPFFTNGKYSFTVSATMQNENFK
jgi:Flp pilus assembly protein TadG